MIFTQERDVSTIHFVYNLNDISTIPVLIQNNYQYTGTTRSKKRTSTKQHVYTHVTRMALCRSVHLKQRGDKAENGKRHTHGASPLPHTQHKHWWKLCIYTKYHKRCVLCYLCTVSSLYINISPYSTSLNRACNK